MNEYHKIQTKRCPQCGKETYVERIFGAICSACYYDGKSPMTPIPEEHIETLSALTGENVQERIDAATQLGWKGTTPEDVREKLNFLLQTWIDAENDWRRGGSEKPCSVALNAIHEHFASAKTKTTMQNNEQLRELALQWLESFPGEYYNPSNPGQVCFSSSQFMGKGKILMFAEKDLLALIQRENKKFAVEELKNIKKYSVRLPIPGIDVYMVPIRYVKKAIAELGGER